MEKQAEIARLQMQNHNLIKELQNNRNRDNLRNSKSTQMYGGDRELLEKEIAKQKSQMHDMAYRYQLLVQQNSKLQNNQKYLLIKITKYENELQMLKNSVSAVNHNTIINRPQTPMKPKKVREDKLIDECPLKLGSMVELKT